MLYSHCIGIRSRKSGWSGVGEGFLPWARTERSWVSIMTLDIIKLREEYEEPHHLLLTSDGVSLFLRKWKPTTGTSRQSAILILHGITAYSGPYAMIAEPLSERGFPVYSLDLRGHGLSDGNRGDCPRERVICHLKIKTPKSYAAHCWKRRSPERTEKLNKKIGHKKCSNLPRIHK